MELKSTEEVLAMSADELASYRELLDQQRLAFRAHCQMVGDRFRELNSAIEAAAKLGCDGNALRVTPGVAISKALGKAVRQRIGPTIEKGGSLMAQAMAAAESDEA